MTRRGMFETDEGGRDLFTVIDSRSHSTPGDPSKVTTFTRTADLSIAAGVLRLNLGETMAKIHSVNT